MSVKESIESFAPGFSQLSPEEIEAMNTFTIMWTLFEAQVLGSAASAKKIIRKSQHWEEQGHLKENWLIPHLEYFKARYFQNGEPTRRFEYLHLRDNDEPDLVRSILSGNSASPGDELAAMLIIVLRFRNNFFHGLKWAYQMQEQQENFERASQLLQRCMTFTGQ
ncbi:hypothetical protein ISD49_31115 [Pseudomonas aeruginosa]|nr:hypothetical protein [Pseudomonas aeruginosa]MBX6247070.1 hypothetical protein [Pseudomonas aeruginosa]